MARYKGTGVAIQYGDSSGGTSTVYTAVVQVREIGSGPGSGTVDEIDVTDHDSTGGYRQFLQGLKDGGSLDFTINYDPDHASHGASTGLAALFTSGATRDWKIVMTGPTATDIAFEAYVAQFEPVPQFNDALIANVSLRVAGAITWPT